MHDHFPTFLLLSLPFFLFLLLLFRFSGQGGGKEKEGNFYFIPSITFSSIIRVSEYTRNTDENEDMSLLFIKNLIYTVCHRCCDVMCMMMILSEFFVLGNYAAAAPDAGAFGEYMKF